MNHVDDTAATPLDGGAQAAADGVVPTLDASRAAWLARCVLPHEPALRAWLLRRGRGHLDVDDIVQEAYAVLATLADVAHIHNPRAYLFTTAQSIVLQHVRRAQVVSLEAVTDIDQYAGEDIVQPERYAQACQEWRHARSLMAVLQGKCRQVFLLRKVEGMSQKEVAAAMGISESTVEKHMSKALRLMAQALSQDRSSILSRWFDR